MTNKTSLDAFERCILEKSDPQLIALWETGILQTDDLFYILVEQLEQHDCCHNQSSFPETSQGSSTMSNGSLTTYNGFQQLLHVDAGNTLAKEVVSDHPSILPFKGNQEHSRSHVTQSEIDSNIDTDSFLSQTSSMTGKFSCPQCGRTSSRLSNLNAHILTHSENRPRYNCSYCEDTFGREYDKVRHEESVHLGIRYHCVCGKSFSRKCTLTKHIINEHNDDADE